MKGQTKGGTDSPNVNDGETVDLRSIVNEGQHIKAHIPNNAPIGGDTQYETFVVENVTEGKITGIDETWNDEITISRQNGNLHLQSGGKSGEVIKIETIQTRKRNNSSIKIHGSKETVFRQ